VTPWDRHSPAFSPPQSFQHQQLTASPVTYFNHTPLAPLPSPSYFPQPAHAFRSPVPHPAPFAGPYPASPSPAPLALTHSAPSPAPFGTGYGGPYPHHAFSPPGQAAFVAPHPAGLPVFGGDRFGGGPYAVPQGQHQQRPPVIRHQTMPSFGFGQQGRSGKGGYQQGPGGQQSLRPPLAPLRSNTASTTAPSSIRSATSPTGSAFSGLTVEAKKKRVYKVNIPAEAKVEEGETEEPKLRSTIARFPLPAADQVAARESAVAVAGAGEWGLPVELGWSREVHFDEVRLNGLPEMIDVFLPGKEGWDDLRDRLEAERPPSPKMTVAFKFPNFLRPSPPRAGPSEPNLGLHARAGSLSSIPATLLRAVESRQRGHAASQSLSLGPVGSPLSRTFSMPSWSQVQTRLATGIASGLNRLAEEVPLPLSPAVEGRFGGFLPGGVEWRKSTTPRPVLRPPPSPFGSGSESGGGGSGAASPRLRWEAAAGGGKPSLMELSLGFGMIEEDEDEGQEDAGADEGGLATTRKSSVATISTDHATADDSSPDPGVTRPSSSPGTLDVIGERLEERSTVHKRAKSLAVAVLGRAQLDVVRSLSVAHFPPLPPSPPSATFKPEPGLVGNEDGDADVESAAEESEDEALPTSMAGSPDETEEADQRESDDPDEHTLTAIHPDLSLPLVSPGTAPSTASDGSLRLQQHAARKSSPTLPPEPEPVSPTPHPFEFDPPSPPAALVRAALAPALRASTLPGLLRQKNGGVGGEGTMQGTVVVPRVMVDAGIQTEGVVVVGWGVYRLARKVRVTRGEDGWWRRDD